MKAAFALILGLLFAGCATIDHQNGSAFVGDWLYTDEIQSCRYSFKADGSFSGNVTQNGVIISKFHGRWAVKDKALLYTYLGDAFGRIPAGATDRDRVLEVSQDSFLIQAANGDRRRYRRVR